MSLRRTPFTGRRGVEQRWLLTFSDIVLLMTTFFVMMLSMSNINPAPFVAMAQAFAPTPGGGVFDGTKPADPAALDAPLRDQGKQVGYLATILQNRLAGTDNLKDAIVREDGEAVTVSLPSDLLFASGSATLSDAGKAALYALTPMLDGVGNDLVITGHTDPRAPSGGPYLSNWELSLARAQAASRVLQQAGLEQTPVVAGRADGGMEELRLPLGNEDLFTKARRVDIMVLKTRENGGTFGP